MVYCLSPNFAKTTNVWVENGKIWDKLTKQLEKTWKRWDFLKTMIFHSFLYNSWYLIYNSLESREAQMASMRCWQVSKSSKILRAKLPRLLYKSSLITRLISYLVANHRQSNMSSHFNQFGISSDQYHLDWAHGSFDGNHDFGYQHQCQHQSDPMPMRRQSEEILQRQAAPKEAKVLRRKSAESACIGNLESTTLCCDC